jgi:hypothetical protein
VKKEQTRSWQSRTGQVTYSLKAELLINVYEFSPYLSGNTLHLRCRAWETSEREGRLCAFQESNIAGEAPVAPSPRQRGQAASGCGSRYRQLSEEVGTKRAADFSEQRGRALPGQPALETLPTSPPEPASSSASKSCTQGRVVSRRFWLRSES